MHMVEALSAGVARGLQDHCIGEQSLNLVYSLLS